MAEHAKPMVTIELAEYNELLESDKAMKENHLEIYQQILGVATRPRQANFLMNDTLSPEMMYDVAKRFGYTIVQEAKDKYLLAVLKPIKAK